MIYPQKKKRNGEIEKDKDLENNKYKITRENIIKKIMKIIFNIIQFLLVLIIGFYKNRIYKGYIKLRHYLIHRYGQAKTKRITLVFFIIGFIIIYSLILYIWNSFKIKKEDNPLNLLEKNNTIIAQSKKETNNNKTNKISSNSST